MTHDDIIAAIYGNTPKVGSPSFAIVAEIQKYVTMKLKMDRVSLDYYDSISLDDMVSSDMPIELLDDFKNDGWTLSDDKTEIVKYINE